MILVKLEASLFLRRPEIRQLRCGFRLFLLSPKESGGRLLIEPLISTVGLVHSAQALLPSFALPQVVSLCWVLASYCIR